MTAPINPGCPAGGTWYACDAEDPPFQFIGCCRIEACQSHSCPEAELAPASFNPASEGTFADQNCTQHAGDGRPAARFYTCALTDPPFLGCCRSNACAQGGCPAVDLAEAILAEDRGASWGFLGRLGNGTVEAVSVSEVNPSESTSSMSTSRSASTSRTPAPAAAGAASRGSGSSSAVAIPIIGAIVGIVVVFLVGISIIYCVRRRRTWRARRRVGGPISKERIGRPSEPVLTSLAAAEACANDKFSVSGPTTRDSQASTVATQRQRLGELASPCPFHGHARSVLANSGTDDMVYVPWRGSSNSIVSPLRGDEARPASLGVEPPFTPNSSVVGPSGPAVEPVGVVELPAFPER
jgi:hypothetical protein